jgi:long-chain acyl-CoA synthetase
VTLKRPVSADELKRFCGERLADYKVPESFTLLDEPLPRNANGKLLKRTLREAVSA